MRFPNTRREAIGVYDDNKYERPGRHVLGFGAAADQATRGFDLGSQGGAIRKASRREHPHNSYGVGQQRLAEAAEATEAHGICVVVDVAMKGERVLSSLKEVVQKASTVTGVRRYVSYDLKGG